MTILKLGEMLAELNETGLATDHESLFAAINDEVARRIIIAQDNNWTQIRQPGEQQTPPVSVRLIASYVMASVVRMNTKKALAGIGVDGAAMAKLVPSVDVLHQHLARVVRRGGFENAVIADTRMLLQLVVYGQTYEETPRAGIRISAWQLTRKVISDAAKELLRSVGVKPKTLLEKLKPIFSFSEIGDEITGNEVAAKQPTLAYADWLINKMLSHTFNASMPTSTQAFKVMAYAACMREFKARADSLGELIIHDQKRFEQRANRLLVEPLSS